MKRTVLLAAIMLALGASEAPGVPAIETSEAVKTPPQSVIEGVRLRATPIMQTWISRPIPVKRVVYLHIYYGKREMIQETRGPCKADMFGGGVAVRVFQRHCAHPHSTGEFVFRFISLEHQRVIGVRLTTNPVG